MQCTSYSPVYYQARDPRVGASGSSQHVQNCDTSYGEQRSYDNFLTQWTIDEYLGYDKGFLKQIIQNHEATFRYQVQELHRLYRRQSELMDEIKVRENYKRHLQLHVAASNHWLSQAHSEINHTVEYTKSWLLGDQKGTKLSMLSIENMQRPSVFGSENFQEPIEVGSGPWIIRNYGNEVQSLSSRNKVHEKRILDLELPLDLCNEDEDREYFEEGSIYEVPEIKYDDPTKFRHGRSTCNSELDAVKAGDLPSFIFNCKKSNFLVDLNEPIELDSQALSSILPFEMSTGHMGIMNDDPCISEVANPEYVVPKICAPVNHDSRSDDTNSLLAIDLNVLPPNGFPESAVTLKSLEIMSMETKVGDLEGRVLGLSAKSYCSSGPLCSSEDEKPPGLGVKFLDTTCSSEERNDEKVEKAVSAMEKGNGVEENPIKETGINGEFCRLGTCIDLNASLVLGKHSLPLSCRNEIKSAGETDLEAPGSPENQEVSPPRGKSEDIQLVTPPLNSEERQGEPGEKLDMVAAQTLIRIFDSGVQEHFKAPSCELPANYVNCLFWFCEIVLSSSPDLENEIMKLQSGADNDQGEPASCRVHDDFIMMAPKVSKASALNLSHIVRKKKETGSLSLRSERCSSRGTRQCKDFQTEFLPSHASLNKDCHLFEGFLKSGSQRRNAVRSTCAKLKKHSDSVLSSLDGKKSGSFILPRPATRSKRGILQDWGKIRKREGGRRRRTSIFSLLAD